MYYKIENKECEVYKKLHAMRTEELSIHIQNRNAIHERVGLKFEKFLGYGGQQNLDRCTTYQGFRFIEPDKVDPKVWIPSKKHDGIYVPNKRTNAGRDMANFLSTGLKHSWYKRPLEILEIEEGERFTFPYVEICGDIILLFLDDDQNPKDDNVIEITRTEFEKLSAINRKS